MNMMSGIETPSQDGYEFSNSWFVQNIPVWDTLLPRFMPKKILEIGSYEGRSACYLIEKFTAEHDLELHCIDTWAGGLEHQETGMSGIETRFDRNVDNAMRKVPHPVRLHKHRKSSSQALAELLASGHRETFDVIYIDGSHQAPDVLSDAIMSFHLLRTGGLMIFDDYVWSMEDAGKQDSFNMPKPAIDAFMNIFQRKMLVVRGAPIYQLYAAKMFP